MKPKQEKKPLKQLIDQLLISYGLEDRIHEMRLLKLWEELTGKMIARHTRDLKLKKGLLILSIDSAALRQELSYSKEKLIENLNESLGKQVISDIIFR